MENTPAIHVRMQNLLPLEEQADTESILNYAQAIHRETSQWLFDDLSSFSGAVQVDFAIGPPRHPMFFVFATDAEIEARKQELTERLMALPVPRVCGLVAVSTTYRAATSDNQATENMPAIAVPFWPLLDRALLGNPRQIKWRLYEQLSRSHPDYQPPLRVLPVPPWYRRLWHVVSGRPYRPGFIRGKLREIEVCERLPYRPSSDWIDEQGFQAAAQKTIDELKQSVAARPQAMAAYALALKLHEQQQIVEALPYLDSCLLQFPHAAQLHFTRAAWSLESDQVQDGLRHSEACVQHAPEWSAGYYVRGHAFMALEAWQQAEQDFVRAANLQPTMFDAWLRIARIRAHLQQTESALAAVDEALECNPYHPDALALRIELLPRIPLAQDHPQDIMRRIDADLATAHRYSPPHPFFLTRRAERALHAGDPAQTVKDCDEALSLDGQNMYALGLRGAAYLAMDEVDQAFGDLTRAIDLGSEAPAVLEARGRIHLQRGDFELARLDCEHAIAADEDFVLAYLTLAGALMELADDATALQALESAATRAPTWDATHRALAEFYLRQGDLAQAYACTCRAVDCGPEVSLNWLQRGTCQAARGQVEKALFDLQKALELDPELAAAHRARATLNLMRNELELAIVDLSDVLRLVPDDVLSRFQRAQCYLAKNQPEAAREDFDRVIQLCPTLAAAYSGRARSWIESGDKQRAAEDFREATIHDPLRADDFEISRCLAEAAILQREEKYDEALRNIEEALQVNHESAQAIALRAACYWHDERLVEAADDYTWLLDRLKDEEEEKFKRLACLNNRGHVYVEMGEFEKGLVDLHEAVRLAELFGSRECQAYSLSARALAHAGLDEFESANSDFQRSVEIRPENAWVYYNQGLVYDRMGNPREAAVCFNLALALDNPQLPPRKRQRARAYVERQSTT